MFKYCKIQITGRVQGVAFRYYSKLNADRLDLVGTTENQPDGSVETFVCGQDECVDQFIQWCHEGSPASRVEEVKVTELSGGSSQLYKEFIILR
ncbi:MAG: acylphosphatase [Bacteroidota bacterium]